MNSNFKMKTVFLDRDGTINTEKNYLYRIEDFEFIDGAVEAISLLKKHGYRVVVVTNQAGVARGYYTEADVVVLHQYINCELRKYGAEIDAFYYCPHHPTGGIGKYKQICKCRKPETGMFEKASQDIEVDLENSWMIGDNHGDIEAGKRFGVKSILVRTGYGMKLEEKGFDSYDYIFDNLYEAVKFIVREVKDEK